MGEVSGVQSKEWTPNGRVHSNIDAPDRTVGVATVTPAKAPPEAATGEEEEGDGMYSEDIYAQPEPQPVMSVDTSTLPAGTPLPVAAAAAAEESDDDDDGLNVVMDDSDAGAFSCHCFCDRHTNNSTPKHTTCGWPSHAGGGRLFVCRPRAAAAS